MSEILLVRHGRTQWNHIGRQQGREDIPLDDVGTAQAVAAARALAREHWDAVVSSPLSRALGTADLIAAACGLPAPSTDIDLVERHFGQASGMFHEEINSRWPDWVLPGSESRREVYERAMPVLDRLVGEYPHGRLVVVSHGALIRSVVMGIEGESESSRGGIDNLGTTLLAGDVTGGWVLEYYNRTVA